MKAAAKVKIDKNAKTKKKKEVTETAQEVNLVPPAPPMPGEEFTMPTREVLKPENQMRHLSEQQLEEEMPRMLTANNPAAPKNIARFNMKERCYKFEPMVEQVMVHYATDGWLLYKTSDEAKKQLDMERMEGEASARFQAELDKASHDKSVADAGTDVEPPDDSRQLRNQFNFSERAAQTFNYAARDRATFTEPPPTATISGSCTQWEIYDEYIRDLERQKLEELTKQKGNKKSAATTSTTAGSGAVTTKKAEAAIGPGDVLQGRDLGKASRLVERMVNQNTFEEIAADFKYWEDASDTYRQGEGTLLPLWKFHNDKAHKKHVTAICWNPLYWDLFAVGYGSFDFSKQGSGLVCLYSLKNPSYPEQSFTTDSGVMCLHFHPEFPNLLAVGCYDGTVLVYDVRSTDGKPIYAASVKTGKHSEPVWMVFWQVDEMQKALQFVSISSDGFVRLWTLSKSTLEYEDIMKLRLSSRSAAYMLPDDDGGSLGSMEGGCCMDFNKAPGQDHVYLVGTEEGAVHKCSKAYSSEYLSTFRSHAMAVYAVKWNYLHTRMFLSASADWSVNLWDSTQTDKPIMSFNLGDTVGDAAWAPYSATVFAATTDDGKVHVFDLHQNKYQPLCAQKIVAKAKLTRLVFNPKHPVLLVGDDRGTITCLKLSPNLRKTSVPEGKQKFEEMEIAKLDYVIEIARKSQVAEE